MDLRIELVPEYPASCRYRSWDADREDGATDTRSVFGHGPTALEAEVDFIEALAPTTLPPETWARHARLLRRLAVECPVHAHVYLEAAREAEEHSLSPLPSPSSEDVRAA